ncbi:MAG: hypothetical protein U0892_02425 [Pirellulales bacterium]
MSIFFANWIVFFPIACALALTQITLRNQVERAESNPITIAIDVLIRCLFTFALLGFITRGTGLNGGISAFMLLTLILFFVFMLLTLILFLFWELELARRTLLIALLPMVQSPKQMEAASGYLFALSFGFWKYKGDALVWRFRRFQDWGRAVEGSRLAKGCSAITALRLFRLTGSKRLLEKEMLYGERERVERSQMTARLLTPSGSFFSVPLILGFMIYIVPTIVRMMEEFAIEKSPGVSVLLLVGHVSVYYTLWMVMIMLLFGAILIFTWFPILLRFLPFELLFHRYFRAIALRAFAEAAIEKPNLAAACLTASEATPVPIWRRRLEACHSQLQLGASPSQAFKLSKLLNRREASLVDRSFARGNGPYVLRELAEAAIDRSFRFYSVLSQVFMLSIILVTSLLVLGLSFGMFHPLIEMVLELTP